MDTSALRPCLKRFRSTLPHGERLRRAALARLAQVSIHAPAQGATGDARHRLHRPGVSIHAPARGATGSRDQEGGEGVVSIHAPARGATGLGIDATDINQFRSTLPHGERPGVVQADAATSLFRSTLPHGERQCSCVFVSVTARVFRSTLPHGERLAGRDGIAVRVEFRSTLPHGERPPGDRRHSRQPTRFDPRSRTGSDIGAPRGVTVTTCFDPRSRTGSDNASDGPGPDAVGFDPRSRTGSDSTVDTVRRQIAAFRSTLPHGERPWRSPPEPREDTVSIHAPARGATAARWGTPERPTRFDPRSRTGSDL